MPLYEWKPEHSVSVSRFDQEHQALFGLLNELNDAMAAGQGKLVVGRILRELADYCRWHFAGEEDAMRRAGFPGLEEHMVEHHRLTGQVQHYYERFMEEPANVPIDLLFFLRDWLLHHVLETDKQYGRQLNDAGIH
jgi:hemerythrin-like metal-binding protein